MGRLQIARSLLEPAFPLRLHGPQPALPWRRRRGSRAAGEMLLGAANAAWENRYARLAEPLLPLEPSLRLEVLPLRRSYRATVGRNSLVSGACRPTLAPSNL